MDNQTELQFNNEQVIRSLLNKLATAELKCSQYESLVIDLSQQKQELEQTIQELKADKK